MQSCTVAFPLIAELSCRKILRMMAIPGWDSLDTVTRIHKICEIAGIVCLGLLALFEVVQYVYGHRKDTLQTALESNTHNSLQATEAQNAQLLRQEFSSQLSQVEIEQDQSAKELSRQNQHLRHALEARSPRRLTAQQGETLFANLQSFSPQKVILLTPLGDSEALQYARDFQAVLGRAGWLVDGPKWDVRPYAPPELQVFISAKYWGKPNPPSTALATSLGQCQIRWHGNLLVDAAVPDDSIVLVIGRGTSDNAIYAPAMPQL